MKKVLSIAGSDSSGGAGIQADIKTITAHKMYAMTAITALTAQNTTGVYGVEEASPEFVGKQLDCIFRDIYPDAVKIGMVSNQEIFPLGRILTPNIPEAEALSGTEIKDSQDMEEAARIISSFTGGAVLVKGGHLTDRADDLLYEQGKSTWLSGERVENPNTHGTGCTLSSAIACGLAAGKSLEDSVREAKTYITGALKAGLNLGQGSGPLNHMYAL